MFIFLFVLMFIVYEVEGKWDYKYLLGCYGLNYVNVMNNCLLFNEYIIIFLLFSLKIINE